jgi:hypothetical protein
VRALVLGACALASVQAAKTYLEAHFEEFADCDLDTLIKHGLHALRETLQQRSTWRSIRGSCPTARTRTGAGPCPGACALASVQAVCGSQSAKTYLEAHFEEFADCDLDTLIKHGLHALRETRRELVQVRALVLGACALASVQAVCGDKLRVRRETLRHVDRRAVSVGQDVPRGAL